MSLFITLPACLAVCFSPLYLFNTICGELFSLICSNVSSEHEIVVVFFFSHLSSPGILPISGFIDSLFLIKNMWVFILFLICELLKI